MLPVLLSAFLLVSDPATPARDAGVQPVQTTTEEPKKERKVCRNTEHMTGSNRVKRVCKTRTEWAKLGQDHSDGGH